MIAPRVSVIIAAYNWSAVLRTSVASVLRQTYADWELLVVGDACTDDSAEVVAGFDDPRVRWHNLARNVGSQVGPNNAGLALARGEFIAYLGHDDIWYPTHLQSLVAALKSTGADLGYGVMLFYGPPDTEIRAITGLWAPQPQEPFRHIPPSSLMHRRSLVEEIGLWKDHRTIRLPPDYEFVLRAWNHRHAFVGTLQLTAFKFPAAWRADAYSIKDAAEQAECLRRIEAEPEFRERELLNLVASYAAGTAVAIGPPPDAAPGVLVERTKAFKGVESELPPESRTAVLRFDFDQVLPGFEWHGIECDPLHGTFQWSGPARQSSLHLPLSNDVDLDITVRILHAVTADVLQSLRLAVNAQPVALAQRADETGGILFNGRISQDVLVRSRGPVRLTFSVARTVEPRRFDPSNPDPRRLGLAFNWIQVRRAE